VVSLGILRERIAIDLGTAYSIVAHESSKELMRIPSSIAIDSETREPVAYGEEAKIMLGKSSAGLEIIRPLKDGVISHFEAAGHYLSHLVRQARKNPLALRVDILVCVPWGATQVETKSYVERVKNFRQNLRIIREPFAAALGCDIDIFSPAGGTVVDIGGGTVEISTIAHGHMIACSSIRAAGNSMDQMIQERLLRQKLFEVGTNTAEAIKMEFGSVFADDVEQEFEVRGLDRRTHGPGRMNLRTEVLREFLEPLASEIEQKLKDHLRKLSPELRETVTKNGVYFVGGGAHLKGWQNRLKQNLGIEIKIPEQPQFAVIRGMRKVIMRPRKYESILRISETYKPS
jgi:rod shape-determining protein MreB